MDCETSDDDRTLMDDTVAAISAAVTTVISRGWALSHQATLLALSRVLVFLALEHLRAHPQARVGVVAMLANISQSVEVESGVKH